MADVLLRGTIQLYVCHIIIIIIIFIIIIIVVVVS